MVSWKICDKNSKNYDKNKDCVQQMVSNNDVWISHKKFDAKLTKNNKVELIVIIYSVICDANNRFLVCTCEGNM